MSAVRYERLLPQIATIVEHLLQPEATVVPRAKQKLVQAVCTSYFLVLEHNILILDVC